MTRFWAILKKEFRQIARDPLSLGLLIFVPAMLLVMYGYALSFDVKHLRIGVLDHDRTQESREFLDGLFQNPYFDRVATLERVAEADRLLARGNVRAVLVVPRGYAKALSRGEEVGVQVLVDGADATTASTAVGYLEALTDRTTRRLRLEAVERMGREASLPIVVPEPRVWFNPELESGEFLVPGLIGMLLMLSAVIATSLSIVREKERRTMEQMMVSPLRPEELILGKIVPYVIIGIVTTAMILVLSHLLFGVVVRGSLVLLGVTTLIFLFAALGMGTLISAVTRSQQVAFQIATIATILPSIILSGFVFPIRDMPLPIRAMTVIVIPRYFLSSLRAIMLKGATFGVVWPDLVAMLILGLLFNLLAERATRKAV